MNVFNRLTLIVSLVLVPLVLLAQDEEAPPEPPRFIMFNQNQVPAEHLGTLNQAVDSLMKPILDQLADEGLIRNWGILTHAWGDEWNWNWYMFTDDHAAWQTAWSEFVSRTLAADSTAFSQIYDYATHHKDNLYNIRRIYGREPAEGESLSRFVMFNQHQVLGSDLAAANALFDSTSAVVLTEMVDDGTILSWGQATHSWGDEWNFNFWFGSEDHADFVSDWNQFVTRVQEQFPTAFNDWAKYTKAHKDNLYNIRYQR